MDALIALITAGGISIAIVSVFVIRHAAHRPANGELKTLAALERKIVTNQESILKVFKTCKQSAIV